MIELDSTCKILYDILKSSSNGFNTLQSLTKFSTSTLAMHLDHLEESHLIFQDKVSKKYSVNPDPQVLTSLPSLVTLTTTVNLTISETTLKYQTISQLYNQSKEEKHLIPMFIENNKNITWELLNPVIKIGKKIVYNRKNPPHFETQNDNTLKYYLDLNLKPNSKKLLFYEYTYELMPYFFTTISLYKRELICNIHYDADITFPPAILKLNDNIFQEISPKSINPKTFQFKETQIPSNTTYFIFWDSKEFQKFKSENKLSKQSKKTK